MTSKTDHLGKTAECSRNDVTSLATVIGLREESKTVKSLRLKIHDERLSFKAGQWVDMFIPQVDIVGGFSMCSSPEQLQREGTLDLAVKYSQHPPALWVHTKCKEGTNVMVKTGGDVFYDPSIKDPPHDLLLIAGGIGINPIISIFHHINDLSQKDSPQRGDKPVARKVLLLYSAVSKEELIFQENIKSLTEMNSILRCKFFVTKEQVDGCTAGRIDKQDIKETFDWLNKDQTRTFICGPSPMIADIEKLLLVEGLDKKSILYEKWW